MGLVKKTAASSSDEDAAADGGLTVEAALARLDANHDGVVTLEEFQAWWKAAGLKTKGREGELDETLRRVLVAKYGATHEKMKNARGVAFG